MLVSQFFFSPSGMAVMNITLSSAGRVTCVTAESDLSMDDIAFNRTSYNTYYFRSGVSSMEAFALHHNPGVEQRVFCKAVCLLTPQHLTSYYISKPFYSSCTLFSTP